MKSRTTCSLILEIFTKSKPVPILRFLKFSNSRNWRLWPHDLPRSYIQAHFVTFTECFTTCKAPRAGDIPHGLHSNTTSCKAP